jgi:hypothetical protein
MIVAKESPYARGGGFASEAPSRPASDYNEII